MASDLYLHYKQQCREAVTDEELSHIIYCAYADCQYGHLTDIEYGKIYFACVAKRNSL